MPTIKDAQYGSVAVRRYARSRHIKVTLSPGGKLEITAPLYTPLTFLRLFLKTSRAEIDNLIKQQPVVYIHSQKLGRSHFIRFYDTETTQIIYKKPTITVKCPPEKRGQLPVQADIKQYVVRALRNEAKNYLVTRLEMLSKLHGYSYRAVRLTHAKSRWGSCSSSGVISLNIALMRLEDRLIDYVLLHELAHTKEMNHSPAFWQLVARTDPVFRAHRAALKQHSPYI